MDASNEDLTPWSRHGISPLVASAFGGTGRILVVVPAFNEAKNVGTVVDEIRATKLPVLVIDDGSSDNTAVIAAEHGAAVARLPINVGVGGALRCGFRYAVQHGFDVAVQCDGDGQHIASEIQCLILRMVDQKAHLVIGSRFSQTHAPVGQLRRAIMRLLSVLVSRRAGVKLTDTTSGFRAIRMPLLAVFANRYPSQYLGDTFEALLTAASSGYTLAEVSVPMRPRLSGHSSASTWSALKYVLRTLFMLALGTRRRIPSADQYQETVTSARMPS